MSSSAKADDGISQVEKSLGEISEQAMQDEELRKRLLDVLKTQVAALESPLEVVWRMMMEVSVLDVCLLLSQH